MPDSVHEAVLDEVERILRSLDLEGLQNRVYRRLAFDADWAATLSLPCIAVSGVGTESPLGGDTGSVRMGLPVAIRFLYRHPIADVRLEAQLFRLRRKVRLAFAPPGLTVEPVEGLIEVVALNYQGGPVVENEALAYQLISSPLNFQADIFEEIPEV